MMQKEPAIKPRKNDFRFFSSLLFSIAIAILVGLYGYIWPGFDPTAKEYFPQSRNIIWTAFVLGNYAYYWLQSLPLATGKIGSTTSVANDAITSMLPFAVVGVAGMLWWLVPEFKLSGFVVAQLLIAVGTAVTDIYINGQFGALVNRLVQEFKSQD